MAGYQTIEALRPILHRGPVAMPVVNRALVRPLSPRETRNLRIRELRMSGMSKLAIAAEIGVSTRTVDRATIDIAPPPGGWKRGGVPTKFSRPKAQRMRRAGFTFAEIAEDLGCSKNTAMCLVKGHREWHQRDKRRRPTLYAERMVARATKYSLARLRQDDDQKQSADLIKARAIMFWLALKRSPQLSIAKASKYLGGYHPSTVAYQVARCHEVVIALGLQDHALRGPLCKALYAADWREIAQ